MSVNGTLVEDKMHIFEGECADFSFNKCPIYAHDGASAKFRTNSQDMDNSAYSPFYVLCDRIQFGQYPVRPEPKKEKK